jgi:hypothetical protein
MGRERSPGHATEEAQATGRGPISNSFPDPLEHGVGAERRKFRGTGASVAI